MWPKLSFGRRKSDLMRLHDHRNLFAPCGIDIRHHRRAAISPRAQRVAAYCGHDFYPRLGKLGRLHRCRYSCVGRLRRFASSVKGARTGWCERTRADFAALNFRPSLGFLEALRTGTIPLGLINLATLL